MKVRFSIVVLLVALVGVFAFTAMAQDEVAREDTAIFDVDGLAGPEANFDQMNWLLPNNQRSRGLHQAVSEPLFILNYETGEIQPWLAESMESNETLDVWTLNLREGAAWADGEAFDASDVVFTIELLANDDTVTLSNAGQVQTWIDSVEATDDYTVVFNLTEPNPRFLLDFFSVRIWGGINMLPEHVFADVDPYTFKNYDPENGLPLGTGPYVLTSANETEWIYDRNDDWWGAATGTFELPEPLRLIWTVTGDDQVRTTLAANNDLDSIMDITLGAFEAMQAENPNVQAWEDGMPFVWLDPCPRQLSINTQNAPYDTPEMRWMLNNVIDREEVIEIAYEGVTIPSRTLFVEYGGMFPVIDAIEEAGMAFNSGPDLEAAEATLTANGYERNGDGFWEKDGEVLTLSIEVHEGFIEKRRITADLVEQFQRFGIDAVAQIVAGATWEDNKAFGTYENATTDWDGCGSVNEPWASMDRYSGRWWTPVGERTPSNNNHVRWQGENNDAYSEIVAEIGSLPLGDPAIVDMVVEAYGYFYEDLPVIPLNQATKLVPFNTTYWEGWPTAENNFNHPATWWQSTHQILQEITKAG